MYNLSDGTLNGKQVVRWDVAFRCPVGIAATLKEAVKACRELELDPRICIQPVAVMHNDCGEHEVFGA